VLQDKEFERLGSNRTRLVDVRILAATNRDLGALAETGGFRADLYYRLSVFPIRVPPLRERKEDIPGLISHFLDKAAREYGRTLSLTPDALAALTRYDWPGNVREMENLIERLAILVDNERIDAPFLRPYLLQSAPDAPGAEPRTAATPSLKEMEKGEVIAALRRNGWIQYKAARALGLTSRQMGYRVRKFGLEGLIAQERARDRGA